MGQTKDEDLNEITQVEREVGALRQRTEALIDELERRVRDGVDRVQARATQVRRALDVRGQARRHPEAALGAGLLALALLGTSLALGVIRRRRAQAPAERWRRRAALFRQLWLAPERVFSRGESLGRRLMSALVLTVFTQGLRQGLKVIGERFLEDVPPRPQLPAHD